MHLTTPDGQTAIVVGGSVPAVHDGWMWDLTVPGNNDHDFYVVPELDVHRYAYNPTGSGTPVLVHNAGGQLCNLVSGNSQAAAAGTQIHNGPEWAEHLD